jgi:hypothetical protein
MYSLLRRWALVGTAALALLLVAGCGTRQPTGSEPPASPVSPLFPAVESEQVMNVQSSAFQNGGQISARYTVEGDDVSPPLSWSDVPEETRSFVLICDDPDAPSAKNPGPDPWVHWVLFNIPPECRELPEGVSRDVQPHEVAGATQGLNSWPSDNVGYRGPAPPPRSGPHRYFFKLYALDTTLALGANATKQQVTKSMAGHVVAQGQLCGTYER